MFKLLKNLFKNNNSTPSPKHKFKKGDKIKWYPENETPRDVVVIDYEINEDNVVTYMVLDLDTEVIFEWVNENELFRF